MQGHWSLFASWSSKHLFENVGLWLGNARCWAALMQKARGWGQGHQLWLFKAVWAFGGRRRHVVSMCVRTGGRDTDWSLIKILIPTLPTSLPSQQPTLLFVVLVILLQWHRVASKMLANEPEASICSPGASAGPGLVLPSVCSWRYLSASARCLGW